MDSGMHSGTEGISELWTKAQQWGMTRRKFLSLLAAGGAAAVLAACNKSLSGPAVPSVVNKQPFHGTALLGRPTADAITLSLLPSSDTEAYVQYGKTSGNYKNNTTLVSLLQKQPLEIELTNLTKDSLYYYRVCHRVSGESKFSAGTEGTFRTQRAPGSTFNFAIQGDSHPERSDKQFNADLYNITLNRVKEYKPDFFMTIGDDFSVDVSEVKNNLTLQSVENLYINQRNWLAAVGSVSPIFLVNGNHEQAAKYLLDGTPNNIAVYSGKSRIKYFPLPAPGTFYSGDADKVDYVGLRRDYYAWTWGDALFVVIDFYWHSPVVVDNYLFDAGPKITNLWDITLDENQYNWFKQTLEASKAKYKFVFTHQVLGTNRGGIELAPYYEWGGKNKDGTPGFEKNRPGWAMPIHQLMVKNNVTILFHGHDHLYSRQELDGIVYQELPVPADFNYALINPNFYKGVNLPNTGFVNVTVSSANVKVDYINSFLPKDETDARKDGQLAYSYTIQK